MPDAALAPSPPALDPNALAKENKGYQDKIVQAAELLPGKLAESHEQRDREYAAAEKSRPEAPPQLQQVPQPVAKSTDPLHIWGSAAMTMALLGGLLTRQPLTTALGAAAGVMKAYKQGDQEAANAQYQTWKASMDNAMKLYDYQIRSYERIMSNVDRREHEIETEGHNRDIEIMAQVHALGQAYGNAAIINTRNVAEARHVIDSATWNYNTLLGAQAKMDKMHAAEAAIAELKQDPKFIAADAYHKAIMINDVYKGKDPEGYQEAAQAAQAKYKVQVAQATAAVKAANNAYDKYKAGVPLGTIQAGDPNIPDLKKRIDDAEQALAKTLADQEAFESHYMEGEGAKARTTAQEASQYASLADLTAAFKAGKIKAADAQRIAKENGWAQ